MREGFRKVATVARYTLRILVGLSIVIAIWSCSNIPGVKDESVTPIIRVPFVRVLLADDQDKMVIDADGAVAVECLDKGQQTVYYSAQDVLISIHGDRLLVENNRGDLIQDFVDEVNFLPRGSSSHVRVNHKLYRGIIKAIPYGRNVRLINIVYMEDYLRGVVPPEIGPREESEVEAIKAQAVAARTYAIGHLQQYPNEPYDMKSTVVDQLYEGINVENRLVDRAIEETAGEVAMFHDDFINAYYHSTCGGTTDDIAQVWDKPAQSYLIPVSDSNACSWSKYFKWQEQFTEQQLRGRLEQYLSSDRGHQIRLDKITRVNVRHRTAGGRVAELEVVTETDNYLFKKDRIRWAIGRSSNPDLILASDRFDVDISRGAQDQIETITFNGSGYGHGVGMCQCGAIGLSRVGRTHDQILKHYYTGIDLKKLY